MFITYLNIPIPKYILNECTTNIENYNMSKKNVAFCLYGKKTCVVGIDIDVVHTHANWPYNIHMCVGRKFVLHFTIYEYIPPTFNPSTSR